MYQIKWNCVTGQHGRTVVLLNAITLYEYIWNKINKSNKQLLVIDDKQIKIAWDRIEKKFNHDQVRYVTTFLLHI